MRRFLEAASTDRFSALWFLLITTGIREGEALGLQRDCLDFEANRMSVTRSLELFEGVRLKGTKTRSSRRTIDLDGGTARVLQDHLKNLAREGMIVPWAFPDTHGGPVRANNLIRRNFRPILERAGLRHITIHTLRHTYATLMLMKGVNPKIVSERLGHKSVQITLDLYSHVLETMQQPAVKAIEEILEKFSHR